MMEKRRNVLGSAVRSARKSKEKEETDKFGMLRDELYGMNSLNLCFFTLTLCRWKECRVAIFTDFA